MIVQMSIAAAKARTAGIESGLHRPVVQVCMQQKTAFIVRFMLAGDTTEKAVIDETVLQLLTRASHI